MFSFGENPEGKNSKAIGEDDFWEAKFQSAVDYRRSILDIETNTGYRLINAEGDSLPGVVVDLFGQTASVQLRTPGAKTLKGDIKRFLIEKMSVKSLFFSTSTGEKGILEENWENKPEGDITFDENGLKFYADITDGQKTGFFLDQRDNRKLVRDHAKDKRVLDVFSYSGGFSTNAVLGGAKEVVSVDASESAIELCRKNLVLNGFKKAKHEGVVTDAFQYLKDLQPDQFDLIILDPPAFTKHISTVNKAARGYKEINLKALQKIAPGSLLFTFSCSQHISPDLFRKIVFGAAADAGRDVRIVHQLSQGADHPINIFHPEGEYLKGLMLYVD